MNDRDTRGDGYNKLSIEQLNALIDETPIESLNANQIQDVLDEMQNQDPVATEFDPEKSFEILNESFNKVANIGDYKKKKSKKGALVKLAVALAACFLLFVPVDAHGNNTLQRFVIWGEDIFSAIKFPESGQLHFDYGDDQDYSSLSNAVLINGLSDIVSCPTWIPEGFVIVELDVFENTTGMVFKATYEDSIKLKEFSLSIYYYSVLRTDASVEIDPGSEQHETNGTVYYLLSNMGTTKAVWFDYDVTYQLRGDLTEDEVKLIIDSI